MEWLDWTVVGVYVAIVVGISALIARRQKSETDYYVAGRRMGPWPIALSILATQCSANSLIGAPAFIALKHNGGLSWLQYELALPLAMIAVLLLLPIYFQRRITTIYEAVENRFGVGARTTISGIFLFSRALGAAVTLYATAVVVAACLGWNWQHPWAAMLLVGAISILYTTLGGIEADIFSDILQLVVLVGGTIFCIGVVVALLGGVPTDFSEVIAQRRQVLDFSHHGLGDTERYSFWPMLIGGFFLYISYYGCDQSQAQRLLTAKDEKTAQTAIMLNGLLRFPLVLMYCAFGLLLAVWLTRNQTFAAMIPAGRPNFLVPLFIVEYVPAGIRGVIVAGIIAAAMSSLDSTMNSLSAATQKDFLERFWPALRRSSLIGEVARARMITVFWGLACTAMAFLFADTKQTVLELVNMIGSAVYGPIMAVFILILLRRQAAGPIIVVALLTGVGANAVIWQLFPDVSWLWWNVSGTAVTLTLAMALSHRSDDQKPITATGPPSIKIIILALASLTIMATLVLLNRWLGTQ